MSWFIFLLIAAFILFLVFRPKKPVQTLLPLRSTSEITNELVANYRAREAKKPLFFTEFLKEEFPAFADQIIVSRVVQLLEIQQAMEKADVGAEGQHDGPSSLTLDEVFASDTNRTMFAERTNGIFGEGFGSLALADPRPYCSAIERVNKASELKLDLEFGDKVVLAQRALDEASKLVLR
jgi:hypothetical protein